MLLKTRILAALLSVSALGLAAHAAEEAKTQDNQTGAQLDTSGRQAGGAGYGGVGGMGSIGAGDGDTLSQEHKGSTGVGMNNGLHNSQGRVEQPSSVPRAGSSVKEEQTVTPPTTDSTSTTSQTTSPTPFPDEQGIGGSGPSDESPGLCNCTCANDTGPTPLNDATQNK